MASLLNSIYTAALAAAAAPSLTLCLATLIIITIIIFKRGGGGRKKYHPIGGTIFNQLLNFKRLHHYTTDLAHKYKTFRLISPSRNEIYTADPVNVEYILQTNFQNYGKGLYNHMMLEDFMGDGIVTVDGEKWQEQRKVLVHALSTKVAKDSSLVVFKKIAAKLAMVLSEAATSNSVIDIQDLFFKSTLDSIFNVAFGVELDTISGRNEEGTKFIKALDSASVITTWRYVDILWKIKKAYNIGSEAKLKKNIKVIDDYMYKLINTKIEQILQNPHDDDSSLKKDNMFSKFLQFSEKDPKYLRDMILNFINAGKDTTATTLSWFFCMVCKHQNVQEKIAHDIHNATNTSPTTSIGDFAANLNMEALDKMQYLHAALTETLRLHPSVALDPKICFSDDILPDGFSVNKGDMVAYTPYAMGRMKFIWGENAEDFTPERWLDQNGCFQQQSPFKFTAFQAGPRICLGKKFAYLQMKIFSAVLLRYFTFKLSDNNKEVHYKTMINLVIDGGLHVQAFHRS